jgi:hypothetical protein
MLSKRMRTWFWLLDFALVVALLGLAVTGVRFPPKFRIVESVIVLCFVLSLLYRVIAQLPPIRFRIQTIMIVVAAVAVQLSLARAVAQMLGAPDSWAPYVAALLFTPALVRAWTPDPMGRH